MKRALEILGLFTMAAAIFALTELALTLRQARKDETNLAQQSSKIEIHADEVLTLLDSEASLEKQRLSNESRLVQKSTDAIKQLVERTDFNLNGCAHCSPQIQGALPAAASALDAAAHLADVSGVSMQSAGSALTETQKEIQPILSNLALSSNQLATQLPPILASIDASAQNTAVGTAQLTQAVTNVNGTTKDVKDIADKIHDDFMHPTHRIWHYFLTVLGIASDAGNASKL